LSQFYNQNTTKKYFDKLFFDKSIKKRSTFRRAGRSNASAVQALDHFLKM
jgi:hypothetical protein